MGILLKVILVLLLLAVLGLVGFSYYPGALEPEQRAVNQPVTLDVD